MLSGCAASLERNSAPAPLAVDLAALKTCASVLVEEPLARAKAGDVADVAFMKADAATINANGTIRTGRKCVGDVQRRYQGSKQP